MPEPPDAPDVSFRIDFGTLIDDAELEESNVSPTMRELFGEEVVEVLLLSTSALIL